MLFFFFHSYLVVRLALQPRYHWNRAATDDKTGMISNEINSYIIPALSVFLVPLSALFAMLNENQLAHLCNFCRAESSNILKKAILLWEFVVCFCVYCVNLTFTNFAGTTKNIWLTFLYHVPNSLVLRTSQSLCGTLKWNLRLFIGRFIEITRHFRHISSICVKKIYLSTGHYLRMDCIFWDLESRTG